MIEVDLVLLRIIGGIWIVNSLLITILLVASISYIGGRA
jgi:hypothetical protein